MAKTTKSLSTRDIWKRIHSPAKTAYGHLSWVCKLILAEPKRYNQGMWLVAPGITIEPWSRPLNTQFEQYAPLGLPQCGTVACVAGWVVSSLRTSQPRTQVGISEKAKKLLGLTSAQSNELFDGDAVHDLWRNIGGVGWYNKPVAQTPEYAALGVQHIRNFQHKYAKQLKATRLKGR